jgi:hypothetical protein
MNGKGGEIDLIQVFPQYKPSGARREGLPPSAVDILKTWFLSHSERPYPTEAAKRALAEEAGIRISQGMQAAVFSCHSLTALQLDGVWAPLNPFPPPLPLFFPSRIPCSPTYDGHLLVFKCTYTYALSPSCPWLTCICACVCGDDDP